MANTLVDLIHSTVVIKVGDTSKIFFVLAVDRAANRAWVQLPNGAATKGTWDNIPEVCTDFASLLDTGVTDKIIDIGRGQVFVLSKDEVITFSHHTSKTMLGLYAGDEWTSTEVSSKEAYYCSKTVGEYEVGQKLEEHLIAPIIVLPADLETERKGNYNYLVCRSDIGGQGRIKVVDTPKAIGNSFQYNGRPQKPELVYDESNVTVILPSAYTNAGSYTGYFSLKDKSKTKWADGSTDDIPFSWVITKKVVPLPTQKGALTYNGNPQSPEWNGYDSSIMASSGVLSNTDAGVYSARFTLKSNYCWSDGSYSTNVEWVIGRRKITPPKQVGELVYNKKRQSPTWDTNDNLTIIEDIGTVDAGTYPAVFNCDNNHYFDSHDPDNDQQSTVYWTIKRSPTAVPPDILDKEFEYDGEEHYPTWEMDEDNIERITLRGDLSAVDAGDYIIEAYPTDNYCWGNGSIGRIVYQWEITRKPILKDPYLKNTTLEYSGEEQTPQWENFPQDFVEGLGLSATEVGNYRAIFTVDRNHCWTDGTSAPKNISWSIDRKRIEKPSYSGNLVYNGHEQHPNWSYNPGWVELTGDLNGVHAGEYTTIFTPTANYQWNDDGYEPYSVAWEIDKYHYKYPFQAENRNPNNPTMYNPNVSECLVYNGESQTPTLWFGNAYNGSLTMLDYEKAFTVRKTHYAVNVGDYVVELTPDGDHCWEDGNSNPYDVPWRIMKRKLEDPTQDAKGLIIPSPRGEQYYTGDVIYPEFNNYDPDILEMSGQTSAIDVGDYVVYFDIRDKDNYEWSDGRTDKVPVTWRIINPPKLVGYPYQSNYLIYNGKYQSPEWELYDPKAMILIGGTPRKINVGEYPVEFKLKRGYAWIDGKTENATVEWSIDKIKVKCPSVRGADANGNGGQYLELDGKHYPVWDDYEPDVMTMSGDTYTVDDLLHTTIFTLKEPDIYKWNTSPDESVEVKWKLTTPYEPDTDDSDDDDSNPDDDQTDSDEDPVIPADIIGMPGVIDIPPSRLPSLITDGDYIYTLHPGDKFPIELNGVVGGVEFRHAWFFAYVIGLDHNSEIEGEKTIHFQFAKSAENGQEIAFIDKFYGQLGEGKGFCMNKADTANGGWKDSYMRTICKQFYYAMPKAWRKIIIPCPKYTDNVGDGSNSPDLVTTTNDKIFLPSEYECIGRTDFANSAEENYQEQYLYYELNGFRGKHKYNDPDVSVKSWLRSPSQSSEGAFCSVDYSASDLYGESEEEPASLSLGFAPCFAVGGTGAWGTGDGYDPDNPNPDIPISGGGGTATKLKRVHIPQQIFPPFEDGTTKTPQWDEYNATAIVNLGGVWEGIPAGTYHVVLRLNPGYIWEDGTTEVKTVPWRILYLGEEVPEYSPIKVHIPVQINPPHYNGENQSPEWDDWNENAINVVGGKTYGVVAVEYTVKVELRPGYVWEDGTTGKKYLPWVILPSGSVIDSSNDISVEETPEIIEQGDFISRKPYDEVEGDIDNSSGGRVNCCCGCDTGLFDMLNNTQCDDGAGCDCTKDVEI